MLRRITAEIKSLAHTFGSDRPRRIQEGVLRTGVPDGFRTAITEVSGLVEESVKARQELCLKIRDKD